MDYEIDGEIFKIKKKDCHKAHPRYGHYTSGYYDKKDARTGTLIIEKTIDKVINELVKVSNIKKIYAK